VNTSDSEHRPMRTVWNTAEHKCVSPPNQQPYNRW